MWVCSWQCGVCACALMQVLLLLIGRGFTGQYLDIGAWDLATAIGGRVPDAVVTLHPARRLRGCINSQFMDDAWLLKSLRPGLQMVVAHTCGCSSVRLSASAEHAVGVVHSFSIAGTPNLRIAMKTRPKIAQAMAWAAGAAPLALLLHYFTHQHIHECKIQAYRIDQCAMTSLHPAYLMINTSAIVLLAVYLNLIS